MTIQCNFSDASLEFLQSKPLRALRLLPSIGRDNRERGLCFLDRLSKLPLHILDIGDFELSVVLRNEQDIQPVVMAQLTKWTVSCPYLIRRVHAPQLTILAAQHHMFWPRDLDMVQFVSHDLQVSFNLTVLKSLTLPLTSRDMMDVTRLLPSTVELGLLDHGQREQDTDRFFDGLKTLFEHGFRVTSLDATTFQDSKEFQQLAECAPHLKRLRLGQWANVSPAFLKKVFGPSLHHLVVQDECPGYDDWEVDLDSLARGCNYIKNLPLVLVSACIFCSFFTFMVLCRRRVVPCIKSMKKQIETFDFSDRLD